MTAGDLNVSIRQLGFIWNREERVYHHTPKLISFPDLGLPMHVTNAKLHIHIVERLPVRRDEQPHLRVSVLYSRHLCRQELISVGHLTVGPAKCPRRRQHHFPSHTLTSRHGRPPNLGEGVSAACLRVKRQDAANS